MKNSRCSGTLVVKRCSADWLGLGKVEQLQELVQLVAADLAVDGAAVGERRQRHRRPAESRVERAGDEQHRVANLLGAQPPRGWRASTSRLPASLANAAA